MVVRSRLGELAVAVVSLLRVEQRRLGLCQGLLRRWQGQLAQLAQARLGLRDGALGLRHGGARFAGHRADQCVAGLHRLAFDTGTSATMPMIWLPMLTR